MEMGRGPKSAWRTHAKSPLLQSTSPRPILLSNSNCHLFYFNLVEIATLTLRTVWEILGQIPCRFQLMNQKSPFLTDKEI